MKTLHIPLALIVALSVPTAIGAQRTERIRATLTGYEEVPAVSTEGAGRFRGTIDHDEQSIDYELTFGNLQGTVQQSHIHFAQKGVNGSVVIWLCQTTTTPAPAAVAGLTPFCSQAGTVSGTITAANVIAAGTASQQITAGELDEVIAAMRAGVAYVNVHSTPLTPGGEIRGQIRVLDDRRDDRD
ncbi:MAG: CHRD domain-containing protein [Vicinamibacterales bacterium]